MDYRLLIDGNLVAGQTTTGIVNPATGQVFASAPRADRDQAEQAVAAARRAFPKWSAMSFALRRAALEAFADRLEAQLDGFARVLTQEQGKPLAEAQGEMMMTLATLRHYAQQVVEPRTLRRSDAELIIEQRYPLGVVAAITPWNFPVALLMVKLAPALITGNVVIAKPAPTTPLTTLMLGEIAQATLPAGVFQTLADQNDLGPLLTGHPDIDCVSFTGSTATGKKVLGSAVDTLKRFTLELGGNDAAIILDDVDLAVVAPRIFTAATMNAGQICLAAKRIYAPRAMVDPLCAALAALAGKAIVGDGLEQGTTMGPVQNRVQYDKVMAYIEEARREGTIVAGGDAIAGEGFFIAPTIVRDLPDDARLVREEQFGPVIPVLAYDDIDDVIARANASDYGLGGTIWTTDVERGIAVASRIESGTVWVNKHMDIPLDIAFGGAKQSGIGRQQGIEGMEEFTQVRIVNASLDPHPRSTAQAAA